MTFGVKVWRADGKVQVNSEAGVSRIVAQYFKHMVGQVAVDNGPAYAGDGVSSYTQAVSGMAPNGRWAVLVAGPNDSNPCNTADIVKVVINNGSFTASVSNIYAQYSSYWEGVFLRPYPVTFTVIAI